ncbi:MAG: TPM domain-containing protein, partial [Pyrinomonadaceae bacterium]
MQSRRSTFSVAIFALLLCLFACAGTARAQVSAQAPLQQPTGFYKYVNDEANVIDPATKDRLATILNRLKERADIEFAVVTVPTTGETAIFDYSLNVARGWGIGSKEGEKNGLLLVVAVNDHKYQVQVSRHLEGDLPDGLVGQIARQRLRAPFQQNNYSQGLSDFVQSVVATLAEKRGFSIEGIDQSYAYRGTVDERPRGRAGAQVGGGLSLGACCLIGFVVLIIFSMMSRGRKGGGGGGGGC